jgi:PKD repeat protein
VRKIEECKKRPVLAARASPGNFPAQFIAGAAIPIVPLAIVGVGAAAGGVALAAGGDDEPAPTNPPATQPPPTAPPTVPPTAPPTGVSVTCTASPRDGTAPLSVNFTATPSGGTGQYQFDWVFGEPGSPRVSDQNPSFTYTDEPPAGQDFIQYSAVVRVMSPPGQDPLAPRPGQFADCRQIITVRRDRCAGDRTGPGLSVTGLEPAFQFDEGFFCVACSGATTGANVISEASDPAGVREVNVTANLFDCIDIGRGKDFSGLNALRGSGGRSLRGPGASGAEDVGALAQRFSTSVSFATPVCQSPYECRICGYEVTATAVDQCGNDSEPATILVAVDECTGCDTFAPERAMGGAPRAGAKARAARGKGGNSASNRRNRSADDRRVVWTSDLRVAGGRGQIVMNGVASVAPGEGRAYAVTPSVKGENRVEATLVNASGKPGTWRFEFTGNSVKPGSIRVIAGEASLVAGGAIEFRLKGTPGERIVFAFVRN